MSQINSYFSNQLIIIILFPVPNLYSSLIYALLKCLFIGID